MLESGAAEKIKPNPAAARVVTPVHTRVHARLRLKRVGLATQLIQSTRPSALI